jgi:hypothetical protein
MLRAALSLLSAGLAASTIVTDGGCVCLQVLQAGE